jgi:hypothetical protein
MNTRMPIVIITLLICTVLTACGSSPANPGSTPTQDPASIAASQAPTDTSTPEPTATATSTPTETPVPTATPNKTATAAAATQAARSATQQAAKTATAVSALATQQAVDAVWAQLAQDKTISYNQGTLYSPDDFEESWAQRNWYQWWWFDYTMSDFVIMTHIDWETADASFGNGGCGFAIRIKDNDNHLVVFLTPRGDAELGAMTVNGFQYQTVHWRNPDLPNYSSITPPTSGGSDFMVVAEKEFVTAYVDGVKVYQWYVALTSPGDIGYTILSGTNKDFGTSCKFTNTQIWELEE